MKHGELGVEVVEGLVVVHGARIAKRLENGEWGMGNGE
jgi:hypothetical protein